MRKIAVLIAVAMAASAPTAAFAAKKKAAPGPKIYDTTPANHNESSWRFIKDGVWNLALRGPAWSKPADK